jgi:hypothetical protein
LANASGGLATLDDGSTGYKAAFDEEKRTEKLTELAIGSINTEVADPGGTRERKPSPKRKQEPNRHATLGLIRKTRCEAFFSSHNWFHKSNQNQQGELQWQEKTQQLSESIPTEPVSTRRSIR